MSKLFEAFRPDVVDLRQRQADFLERERLAEIEAEAKAKAQKLEKDRQDLRDLFTDETWRRLEKSGGVFKEGSAEFAVGEDTFFSYESSSISSQSGYETMLCIRTPQLPDGQSVKICDNGKTTDEAIAETLSYLYRHVK